MGSRQVIAALTQAAPYINLYDGTTRTRHKEAALPGADPSAHGLSCAFSADGHYMAVGTNESNNGLHVYDLQAGAKVAIVGAIQNGARNCVSFSPDGAFLAVAGASAPGIVLYNTSTWDAFPLSSIGSTGYGCDWSPDGSLLAVAGHNLGTPLTVYETATWSKLTISGALPTQSCLACAFSKDGTRLALVGAQSPYLFVYDTTTWELLPLPGGASGANPTACAWSPDGSLIAVASNNNPYLTVYDATTMGKVTVAGGQPPSQSKGCVFTSDGTELIVVHTSGTFATSYNTSTWAKITSLEGLSGNGLAVAISGANVGGVVSNADTTPVTDALGAPIQRRVLALRRSDLIVVGESQSDSSGRYALPLVGSDPVTVVFQAANQLENSVIVDWVVPE